MVSHEGRRYRIDMQVRLAADADRAFAIFTDVDNLPRINPAVISARQEGDAASGPVRWVTDVRACVSFYCRTLHQVQDMHWTAEPPGGRIAADVVAALSDLHYGAARWRIWPCEPGACLSFQAELEPDFWVPPVVGPWMMERKLREEALQTSRGIDRLAHAP
jgi:hypothetical protein